MARFIFLPGDLEKELNKTLNPDNTINISKLNEQKRNGLQDLEKSKNLNLEIQNKIKMSSIKVLKQMSVHYQYIFCKLYNEAEINKKIYKNYKEKIIKGNYTNATEAIKIIDEILDAYDEMQEMKKSIYKSLNNKKIGTLSQLALNVLPETEEEFKNKLTESFGENADINDYMSVYNFEKNKDKLQEEYNPTNSSSGGKKNKKKEIH